MAKIPAPPTRREVAKESFLYIKRKIKYELPAIITVILAVLIIAGFVVVVRDELAYQKTIEEEYQYGK